jgi:hypothetical protein
MIVIGKPTIKTPIMTLNDPIRRPIAVTGAKSPYPVVVKLKILNEIKIIAKSIIQIIK